MVWFIGGIIGFLLGLLPAFIFFAKGKTGLGCLSLVFLVIFPLVITIGPFVLVGITGSSHSAAAQDTENRPVSTSKETTAKESKAEVPPTDDNSGFLKGFAVLFVIYLITWPPSWIILLLISLMVKSRAQKTLDSIYQLLRRKRSRRDMPSPQERPHQSQFPAPRRRQR